ncbi:MAG: hypothetical protein IJI14_16065 [Anaerolineaceae bacterium]|nr:hypothetical protein [Anaerolineaceae bacterium]
MKFKVKHLLVFLIMTIFFSAVLPALAAEPGEYPEDPFPAYETNLHGIVGPSKFFIWDAPLFYSENYSKVMKWTVLVHGGDLGEAELEFYTNPFSLYWNRALYATDENGETVRYLAPIGRYMATITAFGGENREVQAQRDVEIVIPDPEKSDYADYPDIYWPKTGSDLREYFTKEEFELKFADAE